jgi:hypothetical protein
MSKARIGLVTAVRAIVADVERRIAPEVVIARGVERLAALIDTAERPAVPREQMVAELVRLEQEGRGRAAPMLIARKFASVLDPVEVESLARKLRRWRQNEIRTCPVEPQTSE